MNNERALYFANTILSYMNSFSKKQVTDVIAQMSKEGKVWDIENTSFSSEETVIACMIAELQRDIKQEEQLKAAKSKSGAAVKSVKGFQKFFAKILKSEFVNARPEFAATYMYNGMQCFCTGHLIVGVYAKDDTLPITDNVTLKDVYENNFNDSKIYNYSEKVPFESLATLKGMLKTAKTEVKSRYLGKVAYIYTPPKARCRVSVPLEDLISCIECLGGEADVFIAHTARSDLEPICLKSEYGVALLMPVRRVIKNRAGEVTDNQLELYANEHPEGFVRYRVR